ncbi:MAG TPA: hypothetical protein VD931_12560 [Baekduia sp.]|nr:hypothetical protein [Baekduia sp.]
MGQRSRKRRSPPASSGGSPAPTAGNAPLDDPQAPPAPRPPRRSSAERDAQARAGLEPLAPGERPQWVTIAAVVAAVMTVANAVAPIVGADFQGDARSAATTTVVTTVLLAACAIGMWRAKYWAVLGFETVLLFQILVLFLALLRVETAIATIVVLVALGALCVLFYKLIRAMARIQMPARPELE